MLAKQRRFTRQRRLEVEAWRNAELSWRAEYENDMAYRGDPVGIYGEYPPATMPLTRPYEIDNTTYPRPDWSRVIQLGGAE